MIFAYAWKAGDWESVRIQLAGMHNKPAFINHEGSNLRLGKQDANKGDTVFS